MLRVILVALRAGRGGPVVVLVGRGRLSVPSIVVADANFIHNQMQHKTHCKLHGVLSLFIFDWVVGYLLLVFCGVGVWCRWVVLPIDDTPEYVPPLLTDFPAKNKVMLLLGT